MLVECSEKCWKHSSCTRFTYNKLTKECKFYKTCIEVVDPANTNDGCYLPVLSELPSQTVGKCVYLDGVKGIKANIDACKDLSESDCLRKRDVCIYNRADVLNTAAKLCSNNVELFKNDKVKQPITTAQCSFLCNRNSLCTSFMSDPASKECILLKDGCTEGASVVPARWKKYYSGSYFSTKAQTTGCIHKEAQASSLDVVNKCLKAAYKDCLAMSDCDAYWLNIEVKNHEETQIKQIGVSSNPYSYTMCVELCHKDHECIHLELY